MPEALALYEKLGDEILVEELVTGREIAVALLVIDGALQALPHAEVKVGTGPPDTYYSVERKGLHEKDIVCPVDIDCAEDLAHWSELLFRRMGCVDMARVDFRIDRSGKPYLLEINPLPGLSPFYSIFPFQAQACGYTAESVVKFLLDNAMKRAGR